MFEQAKSVFIIGIKGAAMANLAVILKEMGKSVTGSDVEEKFITDELLKKNRINYTIGFHIKNLPEETDLVIYSAAHAGTNNPIAIEAKKRGIQVISQTEVLANLMKQFKTKIAVSGCHGKTTTSSLLSYALIQLDVKPSYLVGAPSFNGYDGGNYAEDEYFVVEADEYGINPPQDLRPKFHFLNPDYIICTNIDFDHPDVYKDLESTKKAFLEFFDDKKLILCADDANLYQLINRLKKDQYQTYGFSKEADYVISQVRTNEFGTTFSLNGNDFSISLFGDKNVSNAAAVIAMLVTLGFQAEEIRKSIKGFKGAKRRFEKVFENTNYSLYDDYAHHPHEIEATISAACKHFPKRRILVIFQPHTYSRTHSLLKEFSESLSKADRAYILPIFPSAREKKTEFSITSEDIVKQSSSANIFAIKDNAQLIKRLHTDIKKDDVLFTMGAGDVYKLQDEIIKLINQKSKLKIEEKKELFPYLTLRTRTKAEYYIEVKTREELIAAKKYAMEKNLPFFVLGGGSNLAVTKKTLNGLVVKNSYQKTEVVREGKDSVDFLVSSGYPVSRLVQETVEKGYEGFEYHKGLPGTVGGAIYMNSKWTHPVSYFSDSLLYAHIIDENGNERKVEKSYFQFAYDYSILQKTKELLLEVVFRLKKVSPELLKKRAEEAFEYRLKTQPFGVASSGCFFKNPGRTSAGYLIDKAGLKGYAVGGFVVSDKHANFILNKGNGKPKDLVKLVSIIKNKVKAKFGVELEEEVIIM